MLSHHSSLLFMLFVTFQLSCCGVYSAEDYRAPNFPAYFAANVPISCCPSYDPDRSELVQERERESCKAKKEYYDIGCRNLIINVFKETLKSLFIVSMFEILLEVRFKCFLIMYIKICTFIPNSDI